MKPYPPTMREKRRYITARVECEQPCEKKDAVRALWDVAFEFLGVLGASESSFWVMDFDEKSQEAVIRCNNESVSRVLAILAFFDKVSNKKARIHIISVTGTIKKAKSSRP